MAVRNNRTTEYEKLEKYQNSKKETWQVKAGQMAPQYL